MTRPEMVSSAHLVLFEENIHYARDLIAGGAALEGLQNSSKADYGDLGKAHPEDLYRAAWNQAVAAMDHWLHDEVIERAVTLTNDIGNDRPRSLSNLKVPFELVERMQNEAAHVVFREFLEDEYRRRSFHNTEDIALGIKLVTHLTSDQIWNRIGRGFKMTREEVKRRHDHEIIKRRNDISHRADRGTDGQRQPMNAAQARDAVDWVEALVHEISGLLG